MSTQTDNQSFGQDVREAVTSLIRENVDPNQRSKLEINLHHRTQLLNTKAKKLKKKKVSKKKTLTRKEKADMGLFHLPTKSLKYVDMLPLHELWKGYMSNHLSLTNESIPPTVGDPSYDSFSKILVKSDFHGAIVTVTRSRCPSLVGVSGIVAMDTKNTFKVLGKDNKLRTIPKMDSVFKILLKNLEFTIFGKHLTIRPAERSVKKIKNFMEPDL
ncbi:Ribonuclease P protein subunit p29 [Pseudolycoriella hygida]|uniref:Ribonuclease P protein subunit p29 n=1 Tax=Pseudolycoriella hygida TaxID=35572 RepID=A0A9Q0MS19_9DIPT|nr:Ribonuclease P protein subunit p29 [Pseudolycoriella hygida]